MTGAILIGEVIWYYVQSSITTPITGEGVTVIVTAAAIMNLAGFRWHHKDLGWILLAASLSCFALAGAINYSYLKISGSFPFPGPADVFFLLVYPLGIAGLIVLARSMHLGVSLWTVLAALAITGIAFWLLTFPLLLQPSAKLPVSLFTKIILYAYPIADALLFCAVFALLLTMVTRGSEHWLLLTGAMGILISDTIFTYISLHYAWDQPSVYDLGWFAWFACWALAAFPLREERVEGKHHE